VRSHKNRGIADSPPHKVRTVRQQTPTARIALNAVRTAEFSKCGQSTTQGRTVRRLCSKTNRTVRGSVQVSATQLRTIRLTRPRLSASQRDAPPETCKFRWAGTTHRRTVRAPGPDSLLWTDSSPPETHKFLVASSATTADSLPNGPGQSAMDSHAATRNIQVSGALLDLTYGQSAPKARTVRSSPELLFQKIFKLVTFSFEIRAQVSPHANNQLYDL